MKWDDAIIRVLKEEKKPLHTDEITELIQKKGYRNFNNSETPSRSTSSLSSKLSNEKNSKIVKIEHGRYIYKK
ncbi:MAG: winged helix-turn-helix domain-containing protein, partial [Prolixibacteraceae bacterium]|nr:winged helix-turn-helix domain-containing protein [Prolixibacteraceae bacterium]